MNNIVKLRTPMTDHRDALDMRPDRARPNAPDVSFGYAVRSGKLLCGTSRLTDFQNRLLRHLGKAITIPARRAAVSLVRIYNILTLATPKEMGGVAARRVVAAVQGEVPNARPWVAGQDQCDMGSPYNAHPFYGSTRTISARALRPLPRPAFTGGAYGHAGPEACLNFIRNLIYRENSHGAESLRSGQGRALLTQRFRPVFLS